MRMGIRVALVLALATLSAGAWCQDKPCTKADAGRAEKAVERVNNWAQLRKAWQEYRQCDSGTVSELYTEAFVRLLVEWKDVDAIAGSMGDAPFKAFMEKHLKDPSAKDDLESIYSRAKSSCPAKHEAFCGQLADFVKTAEK
jgi:hypothetical protein